MKKIKEKIQFEITKIRHWLLDKGLYYNSKQKLWISCIKKLNKKKSLIVLETGRIRNPDWKISDGNSTHFFSNLDYVTKLISIDNDSENFSGFLTSELYCKSYLTKKQLEKTIMINGDSVLSILNLKENEKIDIVLLDSANDPELTYNEFIAVENKLNSEALIIIDDVTFPGKKGDKLVPYLKEKGLKNVFIKAFPSNGIVFFWK